MKRSFLLALIPVFLLIGVLPGNTQTTQPLFGPDHIPEMRLTLKPSNWPEILDSMKLYGEGMVIGSAEIDGIKYPNVGVRYRGQTSYTYKGEKNPFQIDLSYIHPDQNHQGYRSLTLSNALRDPSYMREYFGFAVAGNYLPTPKANYLKLYINNTYAGLYIVVEPVDHDFLNRRAGDQWSALFKCSPDLEKPQNPRDCRQNTFADLEYEEDANCYLYNYHLKEGEGWPDLIELTRILYQEPDRLDEVLDIDATLWMHAFNNLTANLSSYSGQHSHNYYLFRDGHGRFVPVIWDLNLAFGSFKNTGQGSDLSLEEMVRLDPFLQADNPTKPLISRLLSNELYRKIYVSHMRQMMQEHFRKDGFRTSAAAQLNRIKPAIFQEPNGYYSKEDVENSLDRTTGTKSKVPGLAKFMEDRVSWLRRQEAFTVVEPEVVSVDMKARGTFSSVNVGSFTLSVIASKLPKRLHLYYRFDDQSAFDHVLMDLKPEDDLESGQQRFVSRIIPEEGQNRIQYYVMAENTAAVSFYPENYRQNPLEATLEDLNK